MNVHASRGVPPPHSRARPGPPVRLTRALQPPAVGRRLTRLVVPVVLALLVTAPAWADEPAPRSDVLEIDSDRLPVYWSEPDDAAPGDHLETVIVINGGPGLSHEYTRPLARWIVDAGHRPVFYDQPGTGPGAAGASSYDSERLAAELDLIRQRFGAEQVHLVGHSWGGFVVGAYLDRHPQRVASVVLIDSHAPSHSAFVAASIAIGRAVREMGIFTEPRPTDDCSAEMIAVLPAYFHDPSHADMTHLASSRCSRRAASSTAFAIAGDDFTAAAAAFEGPVLVVAGASDPMGPETFADAVAAYPTAESELYDACGHIPWEECPEPFGRSFASFLDRLPDTEGLAIVEEVVACDCPEGSVCECDHRGLLEERRDRIDLDGDGVDDGTRRIVYRGGVAQRYTDMADGETSERASAMCEGEPPQWESCFYVAVDADGVERFVDLTFEYADDGTIREVRRNAGRDAPPEDCTVIGDRCESPLFGCELECVERFGACGESSLPVSALAVGDDGTPVAMVPLAEGDLPAGSQICWDGALRPDPAGEVQFELHLAAVSDGAPAEASSGSATLPLPMEHVRTQLYREAYTSRSLVRFVLGDARLDVQIGDPTSPFCRDQPGQRCGEGLTCVGEAIGTPNVRATGYCRNLTPIEGQGAPCEEDSDCPGWTPRPLEPEPLICGRPAAETCVPTWTREKLFFADAHPPDGDPEGVSDDLLFTGLARWVTYLELGFVNNHPSLAELSFELRGPGGLVVHRWEGADMNPMEPTVAVRPEGQVASNGVWRLRVTDGVTGQEGWLDVVNLQLWTHME